jgi:integrase
MPKEEKKKMRNPKGVGCYYRKDEYYCWKYVRDGKPIYRSAKTEKGLQEKVRQILSTGGSNSKTLVSEYFNAWLEEVKNLNDIPTYKQYESIYRINIEPAIGSFKVSSIKASDIRNVIAQMNTKVCEIKNKKGEVTSRKVGLSEKTMRHARYIMKTVFTRALTEDKIIQDNPVEKLKIPKKQVKKQRVLSIQELIQYFKAISTSRWVWSVWFDLVSGLRRGELTAFRSSDIDWENKRICINKSNSVQGLGGTKNKEEDFIFLTKIATYFLGKQFDMLKGEKNPVILNDDGTMKSGYRDEDFLVFPTLKGTMIKPNTYYHTIVRYAEKAGIKANPHCFRHTFTFFLRNKISLKELQNALRHEASTSTLDIYGNMIDDMNDETGMTMDNVFTKVENEIEKGIFESNKKSNVISFTDKRKAK